MSLPAGTDIVAGQPIDIDTAWVLLSASRVFRPGRPATDYNRRMIREVRSVLLIPTVVLLVSIFARVLGLDVGLPVPVLLLMAWGMLDAAAHRDSVWRAADQNKLVWVFVQLIPVIGTMAYLILVHRTLLDAEDRATSR